MGRSGRRWVQVMRAKDSDVFDVWYGLGAQVWILVRHFRIPPPPGVFGQSLVAKRLKNDMETHPSPGFGSTARSAVDAKARHPPRVSKFALKFIISRESRDFRRDSR